MDGVTQQNAALVQESAAAAASEEQAQHLTQSISSFSLPAHVIGGAIPIFPTLHYIFISSAIFSLLIRLPHHKP
jgi:hypothetical protein